MSLTRRRFARTVSLSLLASAAFPEAFGQSRDKTVPREDSDPFRSENLVAFNGISMQTFLPLVGESFAVTSDNRSLGTMTLMAVTDLSPKPNPAAASRVAIPKAATPNLAGRAPKPSWQTISAFSVQFQGLGAALPQGTYTISNAGIGSMPLLLVPCRAGITPPTCTAIFNFLKS